MTTTFQNSAMVLSIGIFFTLIILGLAVLAAVALSATGSPPRACPPQRPPRSPRCRRCRCCSPPCSATTRCRRCSAPVLAHLPASHAAYLTGRSFFPSLISPAFASGLLVAFDFAIVACLVAAVASCCAAGSTFTRKSQPAARRQRAHPRRPSRGPRRPRHAAPAESPPLPVRALTAQAWRLNGRTAWQPPMDRGSSGR